MEAMFPDLWAGLKTGGLPVMLLAYLWLSERTERRKLQDERDALLERVIKGLTDSTVSISAAIESITSAKSAVYAMKELVIAKLAGGRDAS